MGNKYRLKKRYTLSLMSIVIAIMVVTVIMTTGYALWGTKLSDCRYGSCLLKTKCGII